MTPKATQNPKLEMVAEALRRGASVSLDLQGTSMLPALWPGDVLTVDPVSHEGLAMGDLVFVAREGRSFVHRLIRRSTFDGCVCWISRGDATRHEDMPLTASQVLGRVVHIRRGHCTLTPSRNLSCLHRGFAWLLRHSARTIGIVLRIHRFRLDQEQMDPAKIFRNLIDSTRGSADIQSARSSR